MTLFADATTSLLVVALDFFVATFLQIGIAPFSTLRLHRDAKLALKKEPDKTPTDRVVGD
jgi:hypothetical protein